MANLSFNLSAADAVFFQSLQANCLLPQLATPGEGELVELFKQKKKAEQKELMAPYTDLLEAEILAELGNRKQTILAKLKESESTSFAVELFSWNTVNYRESLQELKRRTSAMTSAERCDYQLEKYNQDSLFETNGWESNFGTTVHHVDEDGEAQSYYGYYPVKVDRIFRNSDLHLRVSLALGPNFFPFLRYALVKEADADDPQGYSVVKKTLCVRYYPFGVIKEHMTRLLDVAKAKATRSAEGKVTTLSSSVPYGSYESVTGPGVTYAFPADPVRLLGKAPLPPPPIRSVKSHCFCGCESDDE